MRAAVLSFLLVVSASAPQRLGVSSSMATSFGTVDVQTFGNPARGPVALALHGMSAAADVVAEWQRVATELGAAGYSVCMPNLHSNPRTSPSTISDEEVTTLVLELADALR